jgi:hypothetical protein
MRFPGLAGQTHSPSRPRAGNCWGGPPILGYYKDTGNNRERVASFVFIPKPGMALLNQSPNLGIQANENRGLCPARLFTCQNMTEGRLEIGIPELMAGFRQLDR